MAMITKRDTLANLTAWLRVNARRVTNVRIERLPNHGKQWQLSYNNTTNQGAPARALYLLG